MSPADFYRMSGPTEWARPPEQFSYSALGDIEQCPRRWQLEHSRYGDLNSLPKRLSPSAIEGKVVHRVLELLFRRLALHGLPPFGSDEFRAGLAECDVAGTVRRLVAEEATRFERFPRGGAFRLRANTQDLINRVVRLFRGQYELAREKNASESLPRLQSAQSGHLSEAGENTFTRLQRLGVLSEEPLRHPALPFAGVVDLIWRAADGTRLVDFKTGEPSDAHRTQLLYYGLLWWRVTDDQPSSLEIRYPTGTTAVPGDRQILEETETGLRERIDAALAMLSMRPTAARVGEWCRYCDGRAFCDPYWTQNTNAKIRERRAVDVEVVALSEASEHGFDVIDQGGNFGVVVGRAGVLGVFGRISKGQRLRILAARVNGESKEIELHPWTEVFFRGA